MAGLYSRRAGKKLSALLEEAASEERLSLEDEVDLSRVLCARAVSAFEATCIEDVPEALAEKPEKLSRMRAAATQALRGALTHVAGMVERHQRVLNETAIDAEAARYVVAQVVKILQEHLGEGDQLAAIVRDLEALKVPRPQVTIEVR